MTDIKALLDDCPYMEGYQVDDLAPGLGAAVFPQGVSAVKRDILGNCRTEKRYLLRRRGLRGEDWAEAMTRWALEQGLTVQGGRLATPATDGVGVYELTVILNVMQN